MEATGRPSAPRAGHWRTSTANPCVTPARPWPPSSAPARSWWSPSSPNPYDLPEDGKELPLNRAAPVTHDGGKLVRGFTLAGEDGVWWPAEARIDGKRKAVIVTSAKVPEPLHVRYGWAQFPDANLCGPNGLPVPTFRTDTWPLPEIQNLDPDLNREQRKALDQARKAAESRVE